ncbi:MAG: formate dehydrogenase accessory protein FdhE [Syntrophales bacterium]|jgi:FdhE protein|nr:formate dehydrogenase accessory protein FdhE [Syntrophales bacterium]MCK9527066.1 formate dehydrogenase accessory protein FdhE [Syntrophales bacterium]MDX9921809.1 formate dehydrogenase accessory protein FdhE [Syntrophales bacterium]
MAQKLNNSLQTIERYKIANPHYEELLDILGDILILREEFRRKITEDIYTIEKSLVGKKLECGMPLVDFAAGDIDAKDAQRYFLALLDLAEKRELGGEARRIRLDMEGGTFDFLTMIRESFDSGTVEETMEEDDDEFFDLLGFLVEESLRPSLEILAEKYGSLIEASRWAEGFCPICGREPKICELRHEEGEKYLFCGQCGIQWRFPRLKCPFCANEDQQSLAYFTVEDEEKYRVDVCNECNRYIKTIDFRNTNEDANLDIEDIATLHLDILANDEGYD